MIDVMIMELNNGILRIVRTLETKSVNELFSLFNSLKD